MNIFHHSDYREAIQALLDHHLGRGGKVRLAQELNCQPGYISQVLNKSKIHFSPENVIKITQLFSLSPAEVEFLLALLYYERAGSQELRQFHAARIEQIKEEQLKIEKQIKDISHVMDEATKAIYYSHWAYCAIHMLVSIERFQKLEAISQRLKLPPEFVSKVIGFLESKGLVKKDKANGYSIGSTRIHLGKDSPLIKTHHQNFRLKAMLTLVNENDFDLHYSGALTLSQQDAELIRRMVLKLIADMEEVLLPSSNEEMIGLNIDLFKF